MSDLISRQAAIDALRAMQTYKLFAGDDMLLIDQAGAQTELMLLPPIQPKRGRWHYSDGKPADNLQKLAEEIASFKQHVKSDNSDYLTGYLCALSVVEGMIANMRGEQDG